MQRRADAAAIRLFRAWPAAAIYWRDEWGEGNAFIGYPDDPAEVTLELSARSEAEATAKVIIALEVEFDDFIVEPQFCPAAAREAALG